MGYTNPERRREYFREYRKRPEAKHKRRIWDQANNRSSDYRKRYGITVEQYNAMFEAQAGCCAICGTHQSQLKRLLNVDHNHDTQEVRALLCDNCNIALGRFKDNFSLVLQAAIYLQKHDLFEGTTSRSIKVEPNKNTHSTGNEEAPREVITLSDGHSCYC